MLTCKKEMSEEERSKVNLTCYFTEVKNEVINDRKDRLNLMLFKAAGLWS